MEENCEMKTTEIAEPKSKALGSLGGQIVALANALLKEIQDTWDESKIENLRENGRTLVAQAESFMIDSQEKYQSANEFFLSIAQYDKAGSALLDPVVEVAHHPHKLVCDIRTEFRTPAKTAKTIIETKILAWKESERKRIAAEQAKLDAERKAKEAEDRRKLEEKARLEREKAEKERREAEVKAREEREKAEQARREKVEAETRARKAEEEKRVAEEAERKAKEAREKAEREAREAEASGRKAEADAARERAARQKAEEDLARERADRQREQEENERREASRQGEVAIQADLKAQKATDKGEIAAQQRLDLADAHEMSAAAVFQAPTVMAPTVNKSEVTSKGTASGARDWSVEILDEVEVLRAVVKGIDAGGFPISVLNLDPDKMQAAFKRWARVSEIKIYEKNGVRIVETEKLSARTSSKSKAA
jgi:hypothetical protein